MHVNTKSMSQILIFLHVNNFMRVWYLIAKQASEGSGFSLFEIMLHCPSQQFFSHVRMFLDLNQFLAEDIVSCS